MYGDKKPGHSVVGLAMIQVERCFFCFEISGKRVRLAVSITRPQSGRFLISFIVTKLQYT